MKMKKMIIALLLVVLLASVCVQASDRKLTLDRAIAISDTQIILEFSEPIAINKYETNSGPFVVVRYVNSGGGVYRIMDDKSPDYGTYLQWTGALNYVDSKHDRLVFTVYGSVFGVNTLSGIFNYEGKLAEFKDCNIVMTVEELPYDYGVGHYSDNTICNITTKDGEIYLTPTRHVGYEACNIPIEINHRYPVDLTMMEGTEEKAEPVTYDYSLVTLADGTERFEKETDITSIMDVKKNNPLIVAAILGGSSLVCLGLIVVAVIMSKKRKAVS